MNYPEKIVVISHHLYQLLLVLCHPEFRRRYGQEMDQLFRDRSREVWQRGGLTRLAQWWICALVDLAETAFATRIYAFEQREVKMKRILLSTAQGAFGCGGILLLFYTLIKRPMPHWTAAILLCGVIASLSAALALHWAATFRANGPKHK